MAGPLEGLLCRGGQCAFQETGGAHLFCIGLREAGCVQGRERNGEEGEGILAGQVHLCCVGGGGEHPEGWSRAGCPGAKGAREEWKIETQGGGAHGARGLSVGHSMHRQWGEAKAFMGFSLTSSESPL